MALSDTRARLDDSSPDALADSAMTSGRRSVHTVLGLFASGLLLLQVGWMVAFPPFWGMDEVDHVFRASSVATGHWEPSTTTPPDRLLARGEIMRVRTDLVDSARAVCLQHSYSLPGNCTGLGPERDGTVPIASAAGRYNPVYYAVAGTVAKPFHGSAALYAMRVTTVVWSTLLLTGAMWALMTFARSRWPMVGVMLATTPTLLYSTAVAAPNGVHLSAAICLWCSMTALLRRPPPAAGTRGLPALGALVATAGVTTLFTHALGIFWVPLILAGAWGLSGCPPLRRLLSRDVHPWLAIIGAGYLAAGAWVLLARTNDPLAQPVAILDPSPWWYARRGLVLWPLQAIAAFPDKEDGAPALVYAVWFAGALICVGAAVRLLRARMRRAEAVTIALVAIGSLAVPTVLTLMTAHRLGDSWQGRYGSPLTVGFILGLAMLIDQAPEFRQRAQGALVGLAPVLFVVANVVSAVYVMRTTSATPSLVRLSSWHVPPTWLLVALGVVSLAMLTAALRLQPRALNA